MKDVVIMDYEKKYKEALEVAKRKLCFDKAGMVDSFTPNDIYEMFPELKESEDERIRKAIHIYFDWLDGRKDYAPKGKYTIRDMIAWLEKQGKKTMDCSQNHQDSRRPNGCIVLADFNEGEGFYKLHLNYLSKKQVEEVEELVRVWNHEESKTPNEDIKNCIGMCLTDVDEQRFTDYNTSLKECLAWLEKQGEQKQDPCNNCKEVMLNCHNFPCVKKRAFKQGKSALEVINEEDVDNANKVEPKFKIGDTIKCKYDDRQFTIKSINLDVGTYTYTQEGRGSDIDYADKEFELVEQKPIDRAETKSDIEKGKWYVCNTPRYTDFVVGKAYYCPKNGMLKPNENEIARYVAKNCFHLWTINDAKDGDVLNSPSHHFIWIYKDNERYYACLDMNYVTKNVAIGGLFKIPSDACPATKEQRDTLMKAMADAGYAFDFDKKKLKKIEQKPAWSYEDEANLNNIIWLCNNCIKGSETTWIPSQATKIKHLIETIKEKGLVQQNPAWSEEDKKTLERVIRCIENHDYMNVDDIQWLKSIKDRCTWRPSDEQMKDFENFVRGIWESCYDSPYENNAKLLYSLLEQLKKLK